jgi:segregation and condensation protein B
MISVSSKEHLPEHLLVEAALFSAGKPVSLEEISLSTRIDPALVKLYLKKLISSYSRRDTSLEVIKAGRKYSLRVREDYVERISALAAPEVNPKLLKTAALIAYHQPMKQSDLVDMYGSKIYDHVKELSSLGLIRARREGSTKILTTTHKFSEVFGISSVSKKKVKGHVKDRVLDRLSRITLEVYDSEEKEIRADESEEDED